MTPKNFIENIQALAFKNVFNPYSDHCSIYDIENAASIRSKTLLSILQAAASSEIDAIWIGRDLGYRGGRRTGLALTDDVHIQAHAARWEIDVIRSTNGNPVGERTAYVIWDVLNKIDQHIFLWNVFPFHPHDPSDPFSNRQHTAIERKAGEEILITLIEMLKPKRIVAIGNDAALVANRLGTQSNVFKVRHPSYGGQEQFLEEIHELYQISREKEEQMDIFQI